MKIKQISHTDLDGIGACIPVKIFAYKKQIDYSYINISYDEITNSIGSFEFGDINYITDLNFQENDIKLFLKVVKENPTKKFFYFDHHQYTDMELALFSAAQEKFVNFNYIIDTTICAAQITYNYFEKVCGDVNLKSLINLINIYDTWKTDNPLFNEAFLLDKVFWYVISNGGFHEFIFRLERNNWLLPEDFKLAQQRMIQNKLNDYKMFEENGMIIRGEHIFVIPTVEWINDTRFDYPDFKAYFGFNPKKNKISIRVDDDYPEVKQFVIDLLSTRNDDQLISCGGHNFAFGITLKSNELLLDYVQFVSTRVEDFLSKN